MKRVLLIGFLVSIWSLGALGAGDDFAAEWQKLKVIYEKRLTENKSAIEKIEQNSKDITGSQAEKAGKIAKAAVAGTKAYFGKDLLKATLKTIDGAKTLGEMYKEQDRWLDAQMAISEGDLGRLRDENRNLQLNIDLINRYVASVAKARAARSGHFGQAALGSEIHTLKETVDALRARRAERARQAEQARREQEAARQRQQRGDRSEPRGGISPRGPGERPERSAPAPAERQRPERAPPAERQHPERQGPIDIGPKR